MVHDTNFTTMAQYFADTLHLPPWLKGVGIVAGIALIGWSLRWVYRDAEQRMKDGMMVATLVFLFGYPLSLLIWCAFRPAKIELYGRPAGSRRGTQEPHRGRAYARTRNNPQQGPPGLVIGHPAASCRGECKCSDKAGTALLRLHG